MNITTNGLKEFEMTDKQLEQAERELREEMNSHGYGWINGNMSNRLKDTESVKKNYLALV